MTFDAHDTASPPWLDAMGDFTSPLDSALLDCGAGQVLRNTVTILAPTHMAKGVAAQMASTFKIEAKTIHSAFFEPIYPAKVIGAIKQFRDAHDLIAVALPAATVEDRQEATIALAAVLKCKPSVLDAAYRDNERNFGRTLRDLSIDMLSLAEGWRPRASPKTPMLGLVDESSMISSTNVGDIADLCEAAVFLGDGCQLPPPAEKGEGAVEQINGVEAAQSTPDAVCHKFSRNYRLAVAAPAISQTLADLRFVCEADPLTAYADMAGAVTRALAATRSRQTSDGGFEVQRFLDFEDVRAIALGAGMLVEGKNDHRVELNHRFRADLLGADQSRLLLGERVMGSSKQDGASNSVVKNFVHKSPKLIYAGRPKISGTLSGATALLESFAASSGHSFVHADDPSTGITTEFWFDFGQVDYWKTRNVARIGNYPNHSLLLKFGHSGTAHSVQGSQADTVYLRRDCITTWLEIKKKYNGRAPDRGMKPFAQWLYTAISRTQRRVVIFDDLPPASALTALQKAQIREEMAARVGG